MWTGRIYTFDQEQYIFFMRISIHLSARSAVILCVSMNNFLISANLCSLDELYPVLGAVVVNVPSDEELMSNLVYSNLVLYVFMTYLMF